MGGFCLPFSGGCNSGSGSRNRFRRRGNLRDRLLSLQRSRQQEEATANPVKGERPLHGNVPVQCWFIMNGIEVKLFLVSP